MSDLTGVLDGIRIIELASEHAALAGKFLADLGAEVIVVEPPGGHATRGFEPFLGDVPGDERSLWWWFYNAGKVGITLDLDAPVDADRFRSLVASSALVLEGEMPGRLAAVGLDYAQCAQEHADLVWVSVTPFGRTSERGSTPVTDLTLQAGAGPVWSCGYDDHSMAPMRPGGNQGYHTASIWAVVGAMTALFARETLGIGQLVDVSMHAACNVTTEAATYEWLVAGATVQRQTFRHAAVNPTPQRKMHTADGGIVIAALPRRAAEFQALIDWVHELGIEDGIDEFFFLSMGVERGGVLIPEIGSNPEAAAIYQAGADALRHVASMLDAQEFFQGAQRRGIPAGALYAPEDVMENEHFVARGFPVEVLHEDLGRTFVYPGAPFIAPASPWQVRGRAPHVNEHAGVMVGPSDETPE